MDTGAEKSSSESKNACFLVAAFLGAAFIVAFLLKFMWLKPPSAVTLALETVGAGIGASSLDYLSLFKGFLDGSPPPTAAILIMAASSAIDFFGESLLSLS